MEELDVVVQADEGCRERIDEVAEAEVGEAQQERREYRQGEEREKKEQERGRKGPAGEGLFEPPAPSGGPRPHPGRDHPLPGAHESATNDLSCLLLHAFGRVRGACLPQSGLPSQSSIALATSSHCGMLGGDLASFSWSPKTFKFGSDVSAGSLQASWRDGRSLIVLYQLTCVSFWDMNWTNFQAASWFLLFLNTTQSAPAFAKLRTCRPWAWSRPPTCPGSSQLC